jgi:hypothetical protein
MDDPRSYAYLLGHYLEDGHVLTTQPVPLLTVTCDTRYPGLIHEVSYAMAARIGPTGPASYRSTAPE